MRQHSHALDTSKAYIQSLNFKIFYSCVVAAMPAWRHDDDDGDDDELGAMIMVSKRFECAAR